MEALTILFTAFFVWVLASNHSHRKLSLAQQQCKILEGQLMTLHQSNQQAQEYEEKLKHLFESLSVRALQNNSQLYLQQTKEQLSGMEASFSIDPELLDRSLQNRVIVAGPSSLYALLKVISFGWMQVELTQNAREISQASQELFQRFSVFFDHYSKIGSQLKSAVSSYNNATASFQRRVLPQLRRIQEMGVTQNKLPDESELPAPDLTPDEF